jgi:tetratricopeptide (TPR) repeat protein
VFTIIISLLAGVCISLLFGLTHLVHSAAGTILPGIAVAIAAAIFLFRRVSRLVTPAIEEAQRHFSAGRRELGMRRLRDTLRFGRWHPLLAGQLRAQLGTILYDTGDLDGAITTLSRASKRPWESRAILACAHFKKKNDQAMKRAFEDAIKLGDKDSLSFTLYAWCLQARGDKQEAIAILKRGLEKMPADQRLKANVELLDEGKKMKVAPYGDRWARFQLDGSIAGVPRHIPKAMRGFAQRPGFRQRSQKKK